MGAGVGKSVIGEAVGSSVIEMGAGVGASVMPGERDGKSVIGGAVGNWSGASVTPRERVGLVIGQNVSTSLQQSSNNGSLQVVSQ
jgi:hypothetical protein